MTFSVSEKLHSDQLSIPHDAMPGNTGERGGDSPLALVLVLGTISETRRIHAQSILKSMILSKRLRETRAGCQQEAGFTQPLREIFPPLSMWGILTR